MPSVTGLLESCLYVDDLERAARFYREVFGFGQMAADERFCALSVADRQVLLLFVRGASTRPMPASGGLIPPHDGSGPLHVGFSIAGADLPEWERWLATNKIAIESRITWPRGGMSLYFRDPDRHLVEVMTPGIWPIY